ncbi:MAG TPA: hypothetical protein VLI54_03230 [Bacillota bacterium]|nr:hypothetical protein [Bacillota bacterium]
MSDALRRLPDFGMPPADIAVPEQVPIQPPEQIGRIPVFHALAEDSGFIGPNVTHRSTNIVGDPTDSD